MIPTQGNEIIVDTAESASDSAAKMRQPGADLVSWVEGKVRRWEQFRDRGYSRRWAEYWRMWRGQWSEADRNRLSERSRLIAPALAQAIEMSVSEVEEGVFSRPAWFDLQDDIADEDKLDMLIARDNLLEDIDRVNGQDAVSEAVLNAAIFGSGIMKLNTEVFESVELIRDPETFELRTQANPTVRVPWVAVRPDEFIPDPSAVCIQDMLGMAHKTQKPVHAVLEKIERNIYRKDALPFVRPGSASRIGDLVDSTTDPQANIVPADADSIEVVEYHGKVPSKFLMELSEDQTALDRVLRMDLAQRPDEGDGPMVEAIVTIANGAVLLRAMANPFVMKDRAFIAFPWEKVPGRFWGRGVAEKGYNPQKALDAEMRARIDALGFISSPMMGVDSGKLPRGFKMEVKPGKVWLTQGPPSEAVQPLQVGQINPSTFNQTGELTQMVQMGTGAFDTSTQLKSSTQSGGNSANSNSIALGAFVKRSKRAIQNIDRNLLQPLIKKTMWRMMQFAPLRYPTDGKFVVKATMGIVAREIEQLNLTQLMAMMPQEFPQVTVAVAKGIVELSSVVNKGEIMQAMAQALAPPSEEEQQRQKELGDLQFESAKAEATQALLENQKTMAQTREILAQAEERRAKSEVADDKVAVEVRRTQLQEQEILAFQRQNELANRRLDLQEELTAARIRALNSGESSS